MDSPIPERSKEEEVDSPPAQPKGEGAPPPLPSGPGPAPPPLPPAPGPAYKKNSSRRGSIWSALLWAAMVALLLVGWFLQQAGFESIRKMRQLERIPLVEAHALIPGEVAMNGTALDDGPKIPGKYTDIESFYLYWTAEKYVENDDGGSWQLKDSGSRYADSFVMADSTGEVDVSLTQLIGNGARPGLNLDHRHRSGNWRYSEYRLDPGEHFFAFARAEAQHPEGSGREGASRYRLTFSPRKSSFTPILDQDADATSVRSGQGTSGVFASLFSVAAFAFGIMLLCFKLRIHRLLVFLTLLSSLNVFTLLLMGLGMLSVDLKDGEERLKRHNTSAADAIALELDLPEGRFNFYDSLPILQNMPDGAKRDRVLGIREDYAAAIDRSNAILERFPERYLAPLWGVEKKTSLRVEADKQNADFTISKSPIPAWVTSIGGLVALSGGVLGSLFGFRRIKVKRYIENVPTSLSSGLAYGPAEIKGKVSLYDGNDQFVTGPLTGSPCCHVRYKVTEKRGSGKNRKTVTIEQWTRQKPFLCLDEGGWSRVVPEGAEMRVRLSAHRKSGRRNYYEYSLTAGEDIYILGSADVDPITGDSLQVSDGDHEGFPFMISDRSEKETMLSVSKSALAWVSVGFIGIVMLVMLTFAGTGSYSPTDFIIAALTAPAFLVFSTFVLMFNDLVFLRNRVKRAHANIEVALKKRYDLIPNLESIAKTYLAHEQELQKQLAELRAGTRPRTSYSTGEIDAAIRSDQRVTERMLALLESYPELKGNQVVGDLMSRLIRVENEIALMRDGYNDSVELYRTGSQRFPEILLSKTLGFRNAGFLRAELEVRKLPEVNLSP